MAIISPASMSRLTSSSTVTVSAPVSNRRVRPRSWMSGAGMSAAAAPAGTATEQDVRAAGSATTGVACVGGGCARHRGPRGNHEVALVEAAHDFGGDVVVEPNLDLGRGHFAGALVV